MNPPSITIKDPWLSPFTAVIERRMQLVRDAKQRLIMQSGSLSNFALGHLYFGCHKTNGFRTFREWAPNATDIYLIGNFNEWKELKLFRFKKGLHGTWELIVPYSAIQHMDSIRKYLS